jgi:hypothetical protein
MVAVSGNLARAALSMLPRQLLREADADDLPSHMLWAERLLRQADSLHGAVLWLWLQRLLPKTAAMHCSLLYAARGHLRSAGLPGVSL